MIPGILRLNSKVKYGLTSRNVPIYLFTPLDRKFSSCIVGCSQKDVSSNVLVLVNVDHWETSKLTRGNLLKVLGKCGEKTAEEDALFYQYSNLSWKHFDRTTLKEPDFSDYTPIEGFTFNVDPEGCVDIDDTITIGKNGYIYITIANVASWMNQNPTLFQKAAAIGQTLYKNGKVVSPLLPIQYECSLLPEKERYGLALKFQWNETELYNVSFEKVKLINNQSYTYDSIYNSKYATLLQHITFLLTGKHIQDSHAWIEELMIFYNCEVAKELIHQKKGLLRAQEPPVVEKLEQYKTIGADTEFLANKSAYYVNASTPQTHWGLQKDYYCHATSPIRRFADIVNQMVLSGYPVPTYDVATVNERGTCAKKYERDMFFLSQVLSSSKREIEGVTVSDHRVWVPEWKRIITCKNDVPIGSRGILKYSVDMDQPTWKKRMVFRFDSV